MKFMNNYDLVAAQRKFGEGNAHITPNRAYIAVVVARLADWADENSDGWPYWPKPVRAAARAIDLIESTTWGENERRRNEDATDAETTAAIRPIKAFLTRQGVTGADREAILRRSTEGVS